MLLSINEVVDENDDNDDDDDDDDDDYSCYYYKNTPVLIYTPGWREAL